VVTPQVREIWLSSEDTGAYGRDIGTNLPTLLRRMVAQLPPDGRTRLRVGMTNPPFILDQLPAIAEVLRHPAVFAYLHVPVQSGSNRVLAAMNREYTAEGGCAWGGPLGYMRLCLWKVASGLRGGREARGAQPPHTAAASVLYVTILTKGATWSLGCLAPTLRSMVLMYRWKNPFAGC
jgi:hypothetical protein